MPRPVSLVYPAAIKLPVHSYSFGPDPSDDFQHRLRFIGYDKDKLGAETEVVFLDALRIFGESWSAGLGSVFCPACLIHRRALVIMWHYPGWGHVCHECRGSLDEKDGPDKYCVCGNAPHDENCPMAQKFPRPWRYNGW